VRKLGFVTATIVLGFAVGLPLDATPRATAQRGGAYVLVKRDAFLYAAPSNSAEKVRDPWRGRHEVRLGPWWVMRQRGVSDGWVEVKTIPGFRATAHCYHSVAGLDDLDITLYVRHDALAQVTTSRITRRFDDGTSLKLTSGVGVRHRGGRRYEAIIPGATIRLRMREEELGTSYRGARTFPTSRDAVGLLAPGGRLDFHEGRLVAEAGSRRERRGGTVSFSVAETRRGGGGGPARALLAVETNGRRGRIDATVRAPCAEVSGALDGRDVSRERPPRAIHTLDEHHGTRIRAGAALYWPDGSRAGRAATDTALDGRISTSRGRRCFQHRLRAAGRSPDETLSLCVEAHDVL
jgi:hypothetical protein